MTAAGNETCIITLRLNDFKAHSSLSLFLRHIHLKITKTSSIKQEHDKQVKTSLGYVSLLLLLYKKHKRWQIMRIHRILFVS